MNFSKWLNLTLNANRPHKKYHSLKIKSLRKLIKDRLVTLKQSIIRLSRHNQRIYYYVATLNLCSQAEENKLEFDKVFFNDQLYCNAGLKHLRFFLNDHY